MRLVPLVCGALVAGGCATGLPVIHAVDPSEPASPQRSKFGRCETVYYLAGLAIDATVAGGDLAYGEEINLLDVGLLTPFAIDALIGTALVLECLGED